MEKYKKLSLLLNKSKEELERFNVADMFIDDDTGYYLDIDELLKVNEMNNNALMDTYLKAIREIKDLDKNSDTTGPPSAHLESYYQLKLPLLHL